MAQQQGMAEQAAANAARRRRPRPPRPAEDPTITKIRELAALKDQGILTEEEFASAKAKLLA